MKILLGSALLFGIFSIAPLSAQIFVMPKDKAPPANPGGEDLIIDDYPEQQIQRIIDRDTGDLQWVPLCGLPMAPEVYEECMQDFCDSVTRGATKDAIIAISVVSTDDARTRACLRLAAYEEAYYNNCQLTGYGSGYLDDFLAGQVLEVCPLEP